MTPPLLQIITLARRSQCWYSISCSLAKHLLGLEDLLHNASNSNRAYSGFLPSEGVSARKSSSTPAISLYLSAFRRGLTGIVKSRLKPKPRFVLTTEKTSGCYSVGAYNYRAIYALAPGVVKALNPWSPSKCHRHLHSGPLVSLKYGFLCRLYQIYLGTLNDIKTARTCWTGGGWVITASSQ